MLPEAAQYKKEWQSAQKKLRASGEDCAFVYVHLREDTGEPFYVGIGVTETRPWYMKRSDFHRNVREKRGVRVEIIADRLSWKAACFWEQRWINALRGAGYRLVNLTDGGDGVVNPSAEVRTKIGAAIKALGDKHPKKRPEARAKTSVYRKIYLTANPDKNPSKSPEARIKNSDAKKAWHAANPDKHPMKRPEVAAKLSVANMGENNPSKRPEVAAKISAANTGDKNPAKRPEVRAKKSASMKATLARRHQYWGA